MKTLDHVVSSLKEVKKINVVFICLPTDLDKETGLYNTRAIEETLNDIFSLNEHVTVIIKSTVAIGFTMQMSKRYGKNSAFMLNFFVKRVLCLMH